MALCFLDYVDNRNDDISNDHYRTLIDTCCQFSAYFSVVYQADVPNIDALNDYLYQSFYTDSWPGTPATSQGGIMKIYHCNQATNTILKDITSSLFSWCAANRMPEDLAFYRTDKTVFFYSTIHEGECYLLNKKEEKILFADKQNGWNCLDVPDSPKTYF